jgi:hypothetical protein
VTASEPNEPDAASRARRGSTATTRTWYRWTRDLHLYAGLFLSPFVLMYAVSVVLLNHAFLPWGARAPAKADTLNIQIAVEDSANSLAVAKTVQGQLGVHGEIGFVSRRAGNPRISFPIETPGRSTMVRADLSTGQVAIERRVTGAWDATVYLHKMPGPHNVSVRGNWMFTRLWGWLADATVYLILFLSATGIYLWTVRKVERRAGLIFIGAGMLTFLALVTAIIS